MFMVLHLSTIPSSMTFSLYGASTTTLTYESCHCAIALPSITPLTLLATQLDMADGDTLEVHQEQIGGC